MRKNLRFDRIRKLLKRNGRGEWIRTTGLLVPNQALYQAEPRPEKYGFSWCEISRKVRKIFPPLEDHKQNPQVNFQSSADDPESIVGVLERRGNAGPGGATAHLDVVPPGTTPRCPPVSGGRSAWIALRRHGVVILVKPIGAP